MRTSLRLAALVVAVAASVTWLATGAHRGWTRTTVSVEKVEEVTGLKYQEQQRKFVAGVEFVGAGLALAAVLAGASFLIPRRQGLPSRHAG